MRIKNVIIHQSMKKLTVSRRACGPHQASKMVSWCEIEHYPPVAFIEDIPIPNLYLDEAADLLLGARLESKMI